MGIVSLSSLILHMGLQDQDKTQISYTNIMKYMYKQRKQEKRQSKSKLYLIITANRACQELINNKNNRVANYILTVAIVIPLFFSSGALSI